MGKCNNNILNLGSISEQAHRIKQLENAVSNYINPEESDATYNASALRMKQVTSTSQFFDNRDTKSGNCFLFGNEFYLYVGEGKGSEGTYNQFVRISGIFTGEIVNYYPGSLYEGIEEPEDKNVLWLDTSTNKTDTINDPLLYKLNLEIESLKKAVKVLLELRYNGIISGTLNDSTLTEISDSVDERLKPFILGDDDDDDSTERPNLSTESGKTINHITIKEGEYNDILKAYRIGNIIDKELVWCTDRNKMYVPYSGKLYPIGGTSSETIDNNTDIDMTDDRVLEILTELEKVSFVPLNALKDKDNNPVAKYSIRVDQSGKLMVYNSKNDDFQNYINVLKGGGVLPFTDGQTSGGDRFNDLYINSFFLGGNGDSHSRQACSHNFVELSNISDNDISLNGISLFYCGDSMGGDSWESIQLFGTIKAHSTFLIRGKQCSMLDSNTTYLKIDNYDLEWYKKDINFDSKTSVFNKEAYLISFNQSVASFYLAAVDEDNKIYTIDSANATVNINTVNSGSGGSNVNKITNDKMSIAKGYIHAVGVGNDPIVKESETLPLTNYDVSQILFVRWYSLDPVKQSNAEIPDRNELDYWKIVELNSGIDYIEDSIDEGVVKYTPKSSTENKTHADDKHKFSSVKPNCFTMNFGIQATDNGNGATRGFTWTSVGYYDEYLYIRKQGDETWNKIESIKSDNNISFYENSISDINDSSIIYSYPKCLQSSLSKVEYDRIRWETYYGQDVTTHKLLLTIPHGIYEVCVGRMHENYISDIKIMTIKQNSEVSTFKFIQTSDQQGANWEEYQVWSASAAFIAQQESDFDFTINTGDICYNGSRPCEWIDYFDGYNAFLNNYPENFCIGNNDLAPIKMSELGDGAEQPYKINHVVADLFYTQEMDVDNLPIFSGVTYNDPNSTTGYKIPNLYSYNYGDYHFICLNSEIRTGANKTSDSGDDFTSKKLNTMTGVFHVVDTVVNGNSSESTVYRNIESWIIKDLLIWKGQRDLAKTLNDVDTIVSDYRGSEYISGNCGKCILYTHEMPINIVAATKYSEIYSSAGNTGARESAKASLNRHYAFLFPRLFKLWGIRCILGGHKHTPCTTYPVYDSPYIGNADTDYNPASMTLDEFMETSISDKSFTFNPVMQVAINDPNFDSILNNFINTPSTSYTDKRPLGIGSIYNNSSSVVILGDKTLNPGEVDVRADSSQTYAPIVRLEIVDKVTAPCYIMCHATGFKNKSNSDLAGPLKAFWLRTYVQGSDAAGKVDHNTIKSQCHPFYNVLECGQDSIKIKCMRIDGLYSPSDEAGYWNFNRDILQHVSNYRNKLYKEVLKERASQLEKSIWLYNYSNNIDSYSNNTSDATSLVISL